MSTTPTPLLSLPSHPLFKALAAHPPHAPAVTHLADKRTFTYANLLADISSTRRTLLKPDLENARVSLLVENSYEFVVAFLSVLASSGIAVPLCTSHPVKEQLHVVNDSTPSRVLATTGFLDRAGELQKKSGVEVVHLPEFPASSKEEVVKEQGFHEAKEDTPALIIYTSGTTSLPKGVLSLHSTLTSQTSSLQKTWHLSEKDTVLHVLPMHHVHGVVNATLLPLLAGSKIEFAGAFEKQKVFSRLTSGEINIFMGVPTMYSRLLEESKLHPQKPQTKLCISGSAALPDSIRRQWAEIGGGDILERYGMTEIGMALSHTLESRPSGSVGWPLPGVEARIEPDSDSPSGAGELQIRGPSVFSTYWNKPALTASEFTPDRFFKTGDIARIGEKGEFYILGRRSADIIKSGGEKVSALEVERELLETGKVEECAVVGVRDEVWGQRVVAVVVLREGVRWGTEEMRGEMKGRVAGYKVPREMCVVKEVRRNVMGKVGKRELVREMFGEEAL